MSDYSSSCILRQETELVFEICVYIHIGLKIYHTSNPVILFYILLVPLQIDTLEYIIFFNEKSVFVNKDFLKHRVLCKVI